MDGVDQRIRKELQELGFDPQVLDADTVGGPQRIVAFAYRVPTGRFKGQIYTVGISTRCEAVGYPEVPPHWIFVSPPVLDTRDGSNHGVNAFAGRDWVALSRPPGKFWDRIGNKGMKAYMEHLNRVWKRI